MAGSVYFFNRQYFVQFQLQRLLVLKSNCARVFTVKNWDTYTHWQFLILMSTEKETNCFVGIQKPMHFRDNA